MSYSLNFHFETEAEFNAFIDRLAVRPLAASQAPQIAGAQKAPKETATKPAAATTAAATQSTAAASAAQETKVDTSELDFDKDVKPTFLKYFAKDEAGARALVAAQGVKKLSELPKDKLPAVLELINAALA